MWQRKSQSTVPSSTPVAPASIAVRPFTAMAPRFGVAWAALVYALSTLSLVHPALRGAFLVNPASDQFSGYAYREFAAATLRQSGEFPLWNPYILGGIPYVAAQHGDIFYPTVLLRLIMPVDAAMTWSFALHLFLAGLFTYGLLRAWGLPFFASLVGGAAYMLSGQVASLVSPGHDGKLYVSALAPLVLWMILRGMRDGKVWTWGVLSLATGLCVLSPHYQLTYYLGWLAGAFTLYLAFAPSDGALPRAVVFKRLALALVAALVGLGIGSVQFLPFFEYIAFSPRGGGGRGYEYATSYSMPPEELLNAYLPQFSGVLDGYWGRNPLKLHSDYLGASVLVLAGAAIGSRARRGLVWFWAVAALVALFVAFGGHTPFYRLWYLLPMMSVVRAPSMIYFIISLAAAACAAVGTERLLAGNISRRYLIGWGVAGTAVAVLASAGFFTAIATVIADPTQVDRVSANASSVILGAWRSMLFVALTVGALWLLQRRVVSPRLAGWLLVAVVAVDLWSVVRTFFRFSPPASELYAAGPAIRYLQRLREPARVAALPLKPLEVPNDPFLNGDALMIHRIRAVTGHQGNEIQRWVELAGGKSPAPPSNIVNRQFRRLANLKFLLTNAELPPELPDIPGMRLTRRVGPAKNAVGSTVYLYELDELNPAAWVAPVIVKAPPEATLATLLDARFDPRRAAIFDTSVNVPAVQISTLPQPSRIRASIHRAEPHRMRVTLDAPAPTGSALIVSENYYPGWTATVGGKPASIGRADYTLIGVALPEGARTVDLVFQASAYERGRALTLVSVAMAALVCGAGLVLDRRRRG